MNLSKIRLLATHLFARIFTKENRFLVFEALENTTNQRKLILLLLPKDGQLLMVTTFRITFNK